MGEGALRCSLYLSPKLLPVSHVYYILQPGLITSAPAYDLPFLDDAVFVLGHYQEFLNCVATLKVNLDSYFATYVPETLTETFGVWDY